MRACYRAFGRDEEGSRMVDDNEKLTAAIVEGATQWRAKAEQSFRLVGEFMYHFAMLESTLDELLRRMMGLEIISALILSANLDMSKKITLAICGMPYQHNTSIDTNKAIKDLNKIRGISDDRNIVAHTFFGPTASGDGVEFNRTIAKASLDITPIIWSTAEFEAKFNRMREVRERVAALAEAVTPVHSDQESAQWIEESLRSDGPKND